MGSLFFLTGWVNVRTTTQDEAIQPVKDDLKGIPVLCYRHENRSTSAIINGPAILIVRIVHIVSQGDRVSSIRGRIGEKMVRVEKLRNQRPQKMKRGRSLISSFRLLFL